MSTADRATSGLGGRCSPCGVTRAVLDPAIMIINDTMDDVSIDRGPGGG